jgi:hypothetical protein
MAPRSVTSATTPMAAPDSARMLSTTDWMASLSRPLTATFIPLAAKYLQVCVDTARTAGDHGDLSSQVGVAGNGQSHSTPLGQTNLEIGLSCAAGRTPASDRTDWYERAAAWVVMTPLPLGTSLAWLSGLRRGIAVVRIGRDVAGLASHQAGRLAVPGIMSQPSPTDWARGPAWSLVGDGREHVHLGRTGRRCQRGDQAGQRGQRQEHSHRRPGHGELAKCGHTDERRASGNAGRQPQ